jgi:SAM-dependent methyltransferase
MQYDPIKDIISKTIRKSFLLRKIFYLLLDMFFLRQWYIKRHMKNLFGKHQALDYYDAGAGFCQYSDFVLSHWRNSRVLASDLKAYYLNDYQAYAVNHYPERFTMVTADLVDYIPEGKYDLVTAIDILEHIEDDTQVLRNFYQCLKPQGKLLISTPSDKDEAARFTEEHVRPGYDINDLIDKLNKCGFRTVIREFSYGKFGKIGWLLGIKIPLKLVSLSRLLILVLPFYYLLMYWIVGILMCLDLSTNNASGNGIIILAEKPE